MAHPSLPAKSTADLIGYAKANPGKINYGFVPGTVGHISTEMFARNAGIKLTNIPYKGNGNAIADLLGGHVQMMFISILPVIGKIQGGKLNALAVASPAARRSFRTCRPLRSPACPVFRRSSATASRRRRGRRAPSSSG